MDDGDVGPWQRTATSAWPRCCELRAELPRCLALRGAGELEAFSLPHRCWRLWRWDQLHAFVMPQRHRDVLSTPRRKSQTCAGLLVTAGAWAGYGSRQEQEGPSKEAGS